MKTFLFVMTSLCLSSAFAKQTVYNLPKDAVTLSAVAGSVVQTGNICPTDTNCKRDGLNVVVDFPMVGGCADELAALNYSVDLSTQTVYISALQVHRRMSDSIKCIAMKVESRMLEIYELSPGFKVVYLGTGKTEVVP